MREDGRLGRKCGNVYKLNGRFWPIADLYSNFRKDYLSE